MRFMKKVQEHQDINPRLAYRYLKQARNIYHNKLNPALI